MDLKESFFDTGEIRLHVMEGPRSGPAMVLLHGATGSGYDWMSVLPHLCERWHVFTVDLRGHGQSGRPKDLAGYHISHNIQDTLAVLRGKVQEPAVLLGHSYGAVITMLTGMEGQDCLRGLILEDPPLMLRRDNEESKPFLDFFGWAYAMRQHAATLDEVLAEVVKMNPEVPPEALRGWAQNLAWLDPNYLTAITAGNRRETCVNVDFGAHARGITCPVLLMQADPAMGAALVQQDVDFFLANAPQTQLVHFPGSGHGIHSDQTAPFLQAVDEFTAVLA
jgi:pimeloyl-ACP methyl ester carboxylesterase